MESVFMERAMSGPKPVKVVGGKPIEPHIPKPAPLETVHITVEPFTFDISDIIEARLTAVFA